MSPERCRKQFRAHVWTNGVEPKEWTAKGMKLMKRCLLPTEGIEQMRDKIAVEQFLDEQELRVSMALHNPGTATTVAELIESYDSRIGT